MGRRADKYQPIAGKGPTVDIGTVNHSLNDTDIDLIFKQLLLNGL